MTAGDRFMKKIEDYYGELGYPVVWDGEGSKRQLEITFKSESGYFVKAVLVAKGEFRVLLDWMRSYIHVHGSKLLPADLMTQATGKEPSSEDFVHYLQSKYTKIYGL